MDYSELIQKIHKIDVPTADNISRLIESEDSIHFVIASFVDFYIDGFYRLITILDDRGAVRGEDFIVCSRVIRGKISLEIHTTKSFLSVEDFPPGITVEVTKNRG